MRKNKVLPLLALTLAGCQFLPTVEVVSGKPPPETVPMVAVPITPDPPAPVAEAGDRPAPIFAAPLPTAAPPVKAAQGRSTPKPGLAAQVTAATQTETSARFDGATTVYDYIPGAVYEVVARFGYISVVALQPGEEVSDVSGGDAVRWKIDQQFSGNRAYLVIKPLRDDLKSNVLITTDRHEYILDLRSVGANAPYMPRVSWNYPDDFLKLTQQRQARARSLEAAETPIAVDPSKLDYDYRIELIAGERPDWMPVNTFTDGKQTWIQFRPDLGVVEAPVLFARDSEGLAQVNYRIKGSFFIADRPLSVAELVAGRDPQVRVRLTRGGSR